MMKSFQSEMKLRNRIPTSMVEKSKEDICFMAEIDNTCMEVVIPKVKLTEPMGYELSIELIEGYVKIILESKQDIECPRWGTYQER